MGDFDDGFERIRVSPHLDELFCDFKRIAERRGERLGDHGCSHFADGVQFGSVVRRRFERLLRSLVDGPVDGRRGNGSHEDGSESLEQMCVAFHCDHPHLGLMASTHHRSVTTARFNRVERIDDAVDGDSAEGSS